MAKEVNLKESYINNSNLNYQGLPSNGYFVLMCQKFLLNKTKKKFRHLNHDNCFELISSCLFFGSGFKLSRELKAKEGKLKLNCEETCSKHKEEEVNDPKEH